MANGAASSIPKMVTASKKCKKRRFGTLSKEGPKRDQCLIVHGLPETRVVTGSLETSHDIDELSKVIKHIIPPGEVIIIL